MGRIGKTTTVAAAAGGGSPGTKMDDSPALELTPSVSTGMKTRGEGKQGSRGRRWAFSSPIAHGQMLLNLTEAENADQAMEGEEDARMD